MNSRYSEDALTLEILEAINERSNITQRRIASQIGVALGLTNSYLSRCVRKGLVKVKQAPANRYAYYLTPKGFAEKSRLTGEYLSESFRLYRRASESYDRLLAGCQGPLGLFGVSEMTEIAAVRAIERSIPIVAVCDPSTKLKTFLHFPIVNRTVDAPVVKVWALTVLEDAPATYRKLTGFVDAQSVLVPDILGLRTDRE